MRTCLSSAQKFRCWSRSRVSSDIPRNKHLIWVSLAQSTGQFLFHGFCCLLNVGQQVSSTARLYLSSLLTAHHSMSKSIHILLKLLFYIIQQDLRYQKRWEDTRFAILASDLWGSLWPTLFTFSDLLWAFLYFLALWLLPAKLLFSVGWPRDWALLIWEESVLSFCKAFRVGSGLLVLCLPYHSLSQSWLFTLWVLLGGCGVPSHVCKLPPLSAFQDLWLG